MEQSKQNKKKENILILVEAGKQTTRFLQQVLEKDNPEKKYYILHVTQDAMPLHNGARMLALQAVVDVGNGMGAEVSLRFESHLADCVSAFAKEHQITQILIEPPTVAAARKNVWQEIWQGILALLPPETSVHLVP